MWLHKVHHNRNTRECNDKIIKTRLKIPQCTYTRGHQNIVTQTIKVYNTIAVELNKLVHIKLCRRKLKRVLLVETQCSAPSFDRNVLCKC